MSRAVVISALAALACHTLLLFGLHLETRAGPLPVADAAVEISLVAEAPPASAPPAPEPPAAEAPPPPAPVPEPIPEPPTPEPLIAPTPEPKPRSEPKPHPPEAPIRAPARPAHPRTPATAQRSGPTSATGSGAVAAGTNAGNSKPRYRSNPRPEYPAAARQQRQQGRVILSVDVSAEGRPTSVSLARSSGFPALDAAALTAVRRWTFEPARTAGLPTAARVEVPVQFDLTR